MTLAMTIPATIPPSSLSLRDGHETLGVVARGDALATEINSNGLDVSCYVTAVARVA